MFFGDYKSKKKISFNEKKVPTKAELLEATRKQREMRLAEQQRLEASQKILKFLRSARAEESILLNQIKSCLDTATVGKENSSTKRTLANQDHLDILSRKVSESKLLVALISVLGLKRHQQEFLPWILEQIPISFYENKKFLLHRILKLDLEIQSCHGFLTALHHYLKNNENSDLNYTISESSSDMSLQVFILIALNRYQVSKLTRFYGNTNDSTVGYLLFMIYQKFQTALILTIKNFGEKYSITSIADEFDPSGYTTLELIEIYENIQNCAPRSILGFVRKMLISLQQRGHILSSGKENVSDSDSESGENDPALQSLSSFTMTKMAARMMESEYPTLCEYIALVFCFFPSSHFAIESFILYRIDDSFFNYLISTSTEIFTGINFADVESIENPALDMGWCSLFLFAEFYSRILSTMSLKEFYEVQRYCSLQDIVKISRLLLDQCCQLIGHSHKLNLASFIPVDKYIAIASRLLSHLYSLDSQRSYCPPRHWLLYDDELAGLMNTIFDATAINPRLVFIRNLLQTVPFVFSFENRVLLFRRLVSQDKGAYYPFMYGHNSIKARVRRGTVFEDGFDQLNQVGSQLKSRVQITFIDQYGMIEEGIDGGGVFKEFLIECLKTGFDGKLGLFNVTKEQTFYPAANSYALEPEQLQRFGFLGRIIGKALYDGVLIDAKFAKFFLAKWLGKNSLLPELPSLDKELYDGLMFLKNYDGDFADLGLTMTVDVNDFGVNRTINLIPNGSEISITRHNRLQYIYLIANYKLNIQIRRQCAAFFSGLGDIIDPDWLKMFNEVELQLLIGGDEAMIDIQDMKQNCVYGSVYDVNHPTIIAFWNVISNFSQSERKMLLKFVTSCSRPPLLGFSQLDPKLCIRFGGADTDRLRTIY
jgi:ubiquitin-protein ligase E3 C